MQDSIDSAPGKVSTNLSMVYLSSGTKMLSSNKNRKLSLIVSIDRVFEQYVIPDGIDVWITSESETIPGTVVTTGENLRSYIVETPTGQMQRNRLHLNVAPE